MREKHAGEEGVNRNLCRTAHERREQNGTPTVVGGMQGTGRHHSGHRAAKADEHGHDAVTSEAKLTQEAVADEGHLTQNALNYGKRKVTPILLPVVFSVFSEFCVQLRPVLCTFYVR